MKIYAFSAIAIVMCLALVGCKKEEPTAGYGVPDQNASPDMMDKQMEQNRDQWDKNKDQMDKNKEQMQREQDRYNNSYDKDREWGKSSSSIEHSQKRRNSYERQYVR